MSDAEDIEERIQRLEQQLVADGDRVRVAVSREALVSVAPHTIDDCVRLVAMMDEVPWHWLDEADPVEVSES